MELPLALTSSLLEFDEECKLKVYPDSLGILTIGIGRNVQEKGITREEAEYLLRNDINEAWADLIKLFGRDAIDQWGQCRIAALLDMRVQLGPSRFRKFKQMIQAVKDQNWEIACYASLDSVWAKQCPKRASRISWILQYGKIHSDYHVAVS